MKIKQYLLCGLTSATLLILGSQNDANASLKNQFKQRSACSFETAPYEKDSANSWQRFCVTPNKQVIEYKKFDNHINPIEYVLKGKVGESEFHWDNDINSYYLTEYEIDGNKLIKYSCQSSNGDGCSGQLRKRVLGTKRNSSSNNKVSSNSSKLRNGVHTETWDNGDTYTGNYVNGQRTGKGIYKWNTGASYEGDFVNAELDGKGTYIWKNGDRYSGDWKDGSRTGKGTFTWADGTKYEGDFVDGKIEGEGIYTPVNGKILEGKFENNQLVKSYKLSKSNNTTTNSSNNSTDQNPNFKNLENEVKGMFKNMFN